jgi:ribose transport system substrate-binding protein
MQVRKWVAVVAIAGLATVAGACGSDKNSSSSGGSSSSGSKNYKLTLIAGVKGDEFYITMNCGAQAEAKAKGATLDFQGPDQFDAAQQTPIVNAVQA